MFLVWLLALNSFLVLLQIFHLTHILFIFVLFLNASNIEKHLFFSWSWQGFLQCLQWLLTTEDWCRWQQNKGSFLSTHYTVQLCCVSLPYLDSLQKLSAALFDVVKGTPFGQHEEVSQDVVQVTARGASWRRWRRSWYWCCHHFPHDFLMNVLYGCTSGAGITAAQTIPPAQRLLVWHFHLFT